MRDSITKLFEETGKHYLERDIATITLHQGHDVHAFYRLCKHPTKVIHIQGYTGMSSENKAHISVRMMNYDKMLEIRKWFGTSIGNEHGAVIPQTTHWSIDIPYSTIVLEGRLAEYFPELR